MNSNCAGEQAIFWLLQKHRLNAILQPDHHNEENIGTTRGEEERKRLLVETCLPETSVIVDRCRQHYALIARQGSTGIRRGGGSDGNSGVGGGAIIATATLRTIAHVLRLAAPFWSADDKETVMKQVVSITLDGGCPISVAQDLLVALTALAERNPAKVYASRLCFYCDSQNDPSLRDQVAEVAGMIRALEYFIRVLFTGGESDLCAQFLYANLSSNSLGTVPFPHHLSEEELNDLLCGPKDYPHVAQLINGCLASRLSSVRRCAYETLANVALFAKAHRGPKAYDVLLRTRRRGVEKDPRLVVVLAALVWEVVFVDAEAQEERLVPSGAPGSYGLLDDLFAESVEVRLVAFHSIGRLLFHFWIPGEEKDHGGRQHAGRTDTAEKGGRGYECPLAQEKHGEELVSDGEELDLLPRSSPLRGHGGGGNGYSEHDDTPHATATACAEHAVLRVSLILHESTRRFDSRVRTAARGLARGLRLRKRQARRLLARSSLLVLDHGLANGSLDELRGRFPAPRRDTEMGFLGSPVEAMSVSPEDKHEQHRNGFVFGDGGCASKRGLPLGSGLRRSVESFDGKEGVYGRGGSGEYCEDPRHRSSGVGVTGRPPSKDALQYAGAIHFLTGILSSEDQAFVRAAIEQRLGEHFDSGDDFWGGDDYGWLAGDGGGSCVMNVEAAAAWLMDGTVAHCNSLLGEG